MKEVPKSFIIEECKRRARLNEKDDVKIENNQIRVKKDNGIQLFPFMVSDNKKVNVYELSKRNNQIFLCKIPEDGINVKNKKVKSQNGKISKNRNHVQKEFVVLGMMMATTMLTLFPLAAKGMSHNYQKIEIEKDLEEDYDLTKPIYLETVPSKEDSLEETKIELQEIPKETIEETHVDTSLETTPEMTEEVKPVFYDVKCPADIQEFMYETCLDYGVPFQVGMTIGHIESRGYWNNSGKISSTNDYGYMQINKVNMDDLYEKFHKEGESKEEFLRAMQYDDKRNIKCSIYLLSKICDMYEPNDFENILGTYNGWKKWREKKISREYVALGKEYLADIYVPLENDETRAFTR